jgi:hypothetical protein
MKQFAKCIRWHVYGHKAKFATLDGKTNHVGLRKFDSHEQLMNAGNTGKMMIVGWLNPYGFLNVPVFYVQCFNQFLIVGDLFGIDRAMNYLIEWKQGAYVHYWMGKQMDNPIEM